MHAQPLHQGRGHCLIPFGIFNHRNECTVTPTDTLLSPLATPVKFYDTHFGLAWRGMAYFILAESISYVHSR
jgi:hypothetical protein